eukprot:5364299-Pleurochrysis_carterae.AAC.3
MRVDLALAVAVSSRKGFFKMNSGSLTLTAELPARCVSFKDAVVVELVGEDPLGLADERVVWTLHGVKGVVCYLALELLDASRAPFFFVRAAVDILVVFGRR